MSIFALIVALVWPPAVAYGVAWRTKMRRTIRRLRTRMAELVVEKDQLAQRTEGIAKQLHQTKTQMADFVKLPCAHCGNPLQTHRWTEVNGGTYIPSCKMASA